MEEQLLQLLADTFSADETTRKNAEAHLLQIQSNDAFPTSLATIASHTNVPPNVRQAALLLLKTFVQSSWSGLDEGINPTIPISEPNKERLRTQLLEIAIGSGEVDDRKVKGAARYAGAVFLRVCKLIIAQLRGKQDCQCRFPGTMAQFITYSTSHHSYCK